MNEDLTSLTSLPKVFLVNNSDTTAYVAVLANEPQSQPNVYSQVQAPLLLALILLVLAHAFKAFATEGEKLKNVINSLMEMPIDICLILIATYVSAIHQQSNLELLVYTIVIFILAMLFCCIVRSIYLKQCNEESSPYYVPKMFGLIVLGYLPVIALFIHYFI